MSFALPTLRSTAPAPARAAEPIQFLDARILALLRDGRLRTPAQVAAALQVAPIAVGDALARLMSQRRVLKAGYAVPRAGKPHGYGTPWPALWTLARPSAGAARPCHRRA